MHRILVEEKRWVSERRFLHALNYCMLLPGPEAQQLATYIGWLMHRTLGGLIAGGLFILPGIVAIISAVGSDPRGTARDLGDVYPVLSLDFRGRTLR
jgi:chromate transport protein ChrA